MYGTGTPKLVNSALGITINPTCKNRLSRGKNNFDKERESPKDETVKFIDIGKHLKYDWYISQVTEYEYELWRTLIAQECDFYEHDDNAKNNKFIVLDVQLLYIDNESIL